VDSANRIKNGDGYEYQTQTSQPAEVPKPQPPRPKKQSQHIKTQLPSLKVNVPLALTGSEVFETFSTVCKACTF